MTDIVKQLDEPTKKRNRTLGGVLLILAFVLAIGTYIGLSITRFNPFDKPPPSKYEGGM